MTTDEVRVVLDEDEDVRRLFEDEYEDQLLSNGDHGAIVQHTTTNGDLDHMDKDNNNNDETSSDDDKPLQPKRLKLANDNQQLHSNNDDDDDDDNDNDDDVPVSQRTTFFDLKQPQQVKRALFRELSDLEQFASDETAASSVRSGKQVPVSDARLQALMRQKYVRPAAYVLGSSELKTQYEMDEEDETFLAELNEQSRKTGNGKKQQNTLKKQRTYHLRK